MRKYTLKGLKVDPIELNKLTFPEFAKKYSHLFTEEFKTKKLKTEHMKKHFDWVKIQLEKWD